MHFESLTYRVIETKPNWKIIDIGAASQPFKKADVAVDIVSYEKRSTSNCMERNIPEKFTKDTWYEIDLMKDQTWPFKDKEFDLAVCSHTLEDLEKPEVAVREMNRIASKFYIEIPSRFAEQSEKLERPGLVGYSHHHWIVVPTLETDGPKLTFYKKNLEVLNWYSLNCPGFLAMNKNHLGVGVYMSANFSYEFVEDTARLEKFYQETVELSEKIPDLWETHAAFPQSTGTDPFIKPMTFVSEL